MGMTAAFTYNTADAETKLTFRGFDIPVVITVDRKTAGVPAWAYKLVELEIIYEIIIKIRGNRVVFFDHKSYHITVVLWNTHSCVEKQESKLWSGRFLLLNL